MSKNPNSQAPVGNVQDNQAQKSAIQRQRDPKTGHFLKGHKIGRPRNRHYKHVKPLAPPEFKQAMRRITSAGMEAFQKRVNAGDHQSFELAAAYGFGKPLQSILKAQINLDFSSWTPEQLDAFRRSGNPPKSEPE